MNCVIQRLLETNPDAEIKVADGFQSAIVGYDKFSNCIIYSAKKCISILTREEKMSIAQSWMHLEMLSEGGGSIYMDDLNDIMDINLN